MEIRATWCHWSDRTLDLLDKTEKSGEEASEVLRAVEVVQDDMSWNWTFSAIEAIKSEIN